MLQLEDLEARRLVEVAVVAVVVRGVDSPISSDANTGAGAGAAAASTTAAAAPRLFCRGAGIVCA